VPFLLLQSIADQFEEELRRNITRLQAAEFLYETSLYPDPEYTFKHALTHEVAYGSILQERRRAVHVRIVETIERLYPDRLVEQVERLAQHASRGEVWGKATAYLHQAGRKAAACSANREAAHYFQQALEALEHLPEDRETLEQAIDIRLDLGPVLRTIKRGSAPEVEQTYTQARELCRRLGDAPQLFPVLWGLCRVYHSGREFHKARELGEQLFFLAQTMQDPALILEAHHTQWSTLFSLGELLSVKEHCERGRALYDPRQHRQHAFLYAGHDPGVCCGSHAAEVLWLLGYADQALRRSHETLSLGRELSHPYSLAYALLWSAKVHKFRGEMEAVRERTEEAMILAMEQGFPRWVMLGAILRGWLSVEQGSEQGIEQIRHALADQTAAAEQQSSLAFVAEAYGKARQPEEGLSVVTEALARAARTGAGYYEAELHRIKGELLRQTVPDEEEAEGRFQKALEIARGQSAKSLELRAAMSLSRLWQRQGKKAEARQLLGEIYGWFTEGFDTADLKQAKALLEELT
jgi:predicted ATPase